MFHELYEPLPDIDGYLNRLELKREDISFDEAGLSLLIRAHLTHIPFDDMDTWGKNIVPGLGVRELYEKIIVSRRGGYCFELNSLFYALLKALGFEAYLVAVQVTGARDYLPPHTHCAIIVTIGGMKYFCDVGLGGPLPLGAVPFDGNAACGYRITSIGDMCYLDEENPGLRHKFTFRDIPIDPVELIPLNFYQAMLDTSAFRQRLIVNLHRPGGEIYSINGSSFKIHSPSGTVELAIESKEQLRDILSEYFGMDVGSYTLKESFPH